MNKLKAQHQKEMCEILKKYNNACKFSQRLLIKTENQQVGNRKLQRENEKLLKSKKSIEVQLNNLKTEVIILDKLIKEIINILKSSIFSLISIEITLKRLINCKI